MVALKGGEIDSFLARPDPRRPVALVYGPDRGLVRERVDALVRGALGGSDDPFALVRLDGDELAGDPARLVDEAQTVPLFGGSRVIVVRAGSRNCAPAIEMLLANPLAESRVVVEAGDLRRGAPLRNVCERAATAVAIPCYADSERDLARLVDNELRAAGLTIAPDARSLLVPLLGGDRQASRNEVKKLALYAAGQGRVEVDDVLAVVADASVAALDGIVDSAFAGRTVEVEARLSRAGETGAAPGSVMSAALRHAATLHKARAAVDAGTSIAAAVDAMQPPVHFRRRPLVEAALKAWSGPRLDRIYRQLAEAALEVRRQPGLAEAIAHRALLSIAVAARRRE